MFTTTRSTRSAIAALAVAAVALAACGNERDASPTDSSTTDTLLSVPVVTTGDPTTPAPDPPDNPDNGGDNDGNGGGDNNGGGDDDGPGEPGNGDDGQNDDGEGDDGEGGGLDPVGEDGDDSDPPAPGPCDDVLATGATLLVNPRPAVLPSGTLSSALTVTNCSDEPVDWTAATIDNVTLAVPGGNLAGGAATDLGFEIDAAAYEPGAIEFKIKVSEPGHNTYVDVQAFRESLGMDAVGGGGGIAVESQGCAVQCVVSAQLTANATSTAVGIDVSTNAPAMLNVYVSTSGFGEENGHPAFSDGGLKVFSNGFVEELSGTIDGLDPATDYNLILEAVDEQGNGWYGTTTFRTITPLDLPNDFETPDGPAGCFAECITAGTVEPQGRGVALHVETHTPALMTAWVSTDGFQLDEDGVPVTDDLEPIADSGDLENTVWDAVINDLEYATDYHMLVRASDLNGGTSYRAGTFRTADGAVITGTYRTVTVESDGEDDNAGEITIAWGLGGETLGFRDEQQIDDGTTVVLDGDDTSFTYVDTDPNEPDLFVPNVTLAEFDPQDIVESCPPTVWTEWAIYDPCGLRINVASGIYDIGGAAIDALPRCSEFGLMDIAELGCLAIEAPNPGTDAVPVFWAVISFEYAA